jgi:hypothetical protein
VGYAAISAMLLILTYFQSDQTFMYWSLVLSVPIFGLLFTTMGQIDPALGGVAEVIADSPIILLNLLWCFVFMWVVLRVALETTLAIAEFLRTRRKSTPANNSRTSKTGI